MTVNIGTADRLIRIALGLVLVGLGIYFKSWWGLVGILPIATAIVGWCWLYTLLGCSTLPGGAPKKTP
jgi:hypothetical protein